MIATDFACVCVLATGTIARILHPGVWGRSPDGASKRTCPRMFAALSTSFNTRRRVSAPARFKRVRRCMGQYGTAFAI